MSSIMKRIIYKKGKTWVLYSKYDHLISEKYCDYFNENIDKYINSVDNM